MAGRLVRFRWTRAAAGRGTAHPKSPNLRNAFSFLYFLGLRQPLSVAPAGASPQISGKTHKTWSPHKTTPLRSQNVVRSHLSPATEPPHSAQAAKQIFADRLCSRIFLDPGDGARNRLWPLLWGRQPVEVTQPSAIIYCDGGVNTRLPRLKLPWNKAKVGWAFRLKDRAKPHVRLHRPSRLGENPKYRLARRNSAQLSVRRAAT